MTENVRPEELAKTAKTAAAMAAVAADRAQKAAKEVAAYAERAFDDRPMTTAEILGQYRRDLIAEGIDPPIINDLVRDLACRVLHEKGVIVGRAESDGAGSAIERLEKRLAVVRERQLRHWRDHAKEVDRIQQEISKLMPAVNGAATPAA